MGLSVEDVPCTMNSLIRYKEAYYCTTLTWCPWWSVHRNSLLY